MKKFTISEAVGYGWNVLKNQTGIVIGITVFTLFAQFAANAFAEGGSKVPEEYRPVILFLALLSMAFGILNFIVQMGYIKAMINSVDGKKIVFSDLFSQVGKFFRLLGAAILIGLIVLGGLLLLVVPGIIWAIRYCFTMQLIIDKDMKISDAMRSSAEATKGSKMDLFVAGIAFFGITIAGLILCGIGLIAAMPITGAGYALIYRRFFPAQ